jgi:hypothetical protein
MHCCSFSVKLSQQAAGLEVQLASNSLRGPSLRIRASNVISARSCAYVVRKQAGIVFA